jgi:hypothetical protein
MKRAALMFLALVTIACGEERSCLIPESQLVSGGPGLDGIPALSNPAVVSVREADSFLAPADLVLGVVAGGEARAYPHQIFWWHEIVNDVLGGVPLVVSYCPLTGSGLVYDPVIDGQLLDFGVSGLLFDNNLVLFDRATESLWSQMRIQSICGSFSGTTPTLLPVVQSTWEAWKALYPDTSVVSFATGFSRNYTQYPYGNYDRIGNNSLLFPQSVIDDRRPLKELVLGITEGQVSRAYPYGTLGPRAAVNDFVGRRAVLVLFDEGAQMALAFDRDVEGQRLSFDIAGEPADFPFRVRDRESGSLWDLTGVAREGPLVGARLEPLVAYSAMWFSWAAFQSGTELYAP